MKNLDLKARGIEVMSKQEMNEIEGAIFSEVYELFTGRSLMGDIRSCFVEMYEESIVNSDDNFRLMVLGH